MSATTAKAATIRRNEILMLAISRVREFRISQRVCLAG
jgi:hypothetical protein